MPQTPNLQRLFLADVPLLLAGLKRASSRSLDGEARHLAGRVREHGVLGAFSDVVRPAEKVIAQGIAGDAVNDLLDALRRTWRRGGRVLVVDEGGALPDVVTSLTWLEVPWVRATSLEEGIAQLNSSGALGLVLVVRGPGGGAGREFLCRLRQDPATNAVPCLVTGVPPVEELEWLALGALECFTNEQALMLSDALAMMVGFESIGVELAPDVLGDCWEPDRFQAAMREAADAYQLAQGPEWCVAAFRVSNAETLGRTGSQALQTAMRSLGKLVIGESAPGTRVGQLGTAEVGAIVHAHSAVAVAFALDGVRRALQPIDTPTGRVAPLITGCVIHAGTASVAQVVRAVHAELGAASRDDLSLRTLQLDNSPKNAVLIVEDDPVFAKLAEIAVEQIGLRAVRAATLLEAERMLDVFARTDFALLILDVSLPDGVSYQLLRRLRAQPRHATVPVILMSSHGSERQVIEGLEGGADDYLVKPVSVPVLVARMRSAIARRARGSGDS